jgi:hypothetical protein
MGKIDRMKALDELAESLGLNEPKEVECFGCKNKIKSNESIVMTKDGNKVYICPDCYKKIEDGVLTKPPVDIGEIIKALEKQKDNGIQKIPNMIPKYPQNIPMNPGDFTAPYIGDITHQTLNWKKWKEEWNTGTGTSYNIQVGTGSTNIEEYKLNSNINSMLLKFEPKK